MAPGRWTNVLVDSPQYWTLKIESVDPSNPPRNFRFFLDETKYVG